MATCGLCDGGEATTTVSGLGLCDVCAHTDPSEKLAARGQPAEFAKVLMRFTAGIHVPGLPEGFTLRIAPERLAHSLVKMVMTEVEVGDPLFDDAIFIRTSDPDAARRYLAPEGVQSALLALLSGVRPEVTPNLVLLEGDAVTLSVRPLEDLDEERWLAYQLEAAALAVHWANVSG